MIPNNVTNIAIDPSQGVDTEFECLCHKCGKINRVILRAKPWGWFLFSPNSVVKLDEKMNTLERVGQQYEQTLSGASLCHHCGAAMDCYTQVLNAGQHGFLEFPN